MEIYSDNINLSIAVIPNSVTKSSTKFAVRSDYFLLLLNVLAVSFGFKQQIPPRKFEAMFSTEYGKHPPSRLIGILRRVVLYQVLPDFLMLMWGAFTRSLKKSTQRVLRQCLHSNPYKLTK